MFFSPQECIAYGSDCKYYTYYGSNNQCLLYSECSTRACDGDEECVTGEVDCDGGSSGGDCDLEDAECDGGTTVRVESASDLEDCRQVRETQLCTECATNFYPLLNLPPVFYLSFYRQKIGTKNQ